jgi:aminopeptidase YwaD
LLNRCRQESKATGWVVNTNPFEGGSDHTPFLNAKIPGLLMWHFTDVFYHTDGDRLEMVSAEEMKHVGVSALATAYLLTRAKNNTTIALIKDITANALQRLKTECALSNAIVKQGGDAAKEKHILEVWRDWYLTALDRTTDIAVSGANNRIRKSIARAQRQVRDACTTCTKDGDAGCFVIVCILLLCRYKDVLSFAVWSFSYEIRSPLFPSYYSGTHSHRAA